MQQCVKKVSFVTVYSKDALLLYGSIAAASNLEGRTVGDTVGV